MVSWIISKCKQREMYQMKSSDDDWDDAGYSPHFRAERGAASPVAQLVSARYLYD